MTANPHFETARSWRQAQTLLSFRPIEPQYTADHRLQALRIHILDHKLRRLEITDRTLEAHYGAFVLSQAHRGTAEARRLALSIPYGPFGTEARIAGHDARTYELGPQVPPDDIDGRNPAVVTWHDQAMHYLVASDQLPVATLIKIANSLYR